MLFERDTALEALRQALARARAGAGLTVAVTGEAGIGKTALLRAFCEGLESGTRVFRAACEDLSIAEPMGALRDLAREAEWDLPVDMTGAGSRIALFSELLEALTHPSVATLIVVEDLHWADDATLDFLRYLGRRLDGRRILLVLTGRDEEAEGRIRLRNALDGVPSDSVRRLALEPLTQAAVSDLARVSGKDSSTLFDVTKGNPLYVTELLREAVSGLPASLSDAVLARADRLPQAARDILSLISIFPRRAEVELVRSVGTSGSSTDAQVEACIDAGLIEEDGEFLAFRHELSRRAVEASLTVSARRALNARLFSVLQGNGEASSARLLHHAREAGDREAMARLAPRAAEDASRAGAIREAAEYWDLAVDALRRAPPDDWVSILSRCAWASYLISRLERAITLQKEALAICRQSGDVVRQGDFYRRLSRFHWSLGETEEAHRYSRLAIDTLAGHSGPELALAHSTVAQLATLNHEFARVPEHAMTAMALAERFDRPEILAHALNNLGHTLVMSRSDPEEGRRLLTRSLETALRIGDPDHTARAYVNRAYLELELLEFDRSAQLALEGLEYCSSRDLDGYASYLRGILGWVRLHQGRWDEAETLARKGLRTSTDASALTPFSFPSACVLAWLSIRRGSPTQDDVARVQEFMSRTDEMQRVVVHAVLVGEMAWLGQAERHEALSLLEGAVARSDHPGHVPHVLLWRHRLDPGRDIPASPLLPKPIAEEISGNWRAAASAWAELGAPYEQALALSFGDLDARHQALAILDGLGADAATQAIRHGLRAEGHRSVPRGPRSSTRANPLGLTRRQLEILGRLNEGLSNAEIGDRLFISAKTVDHHISAILGKLEVSSRGEAAAKARKAGLI